MDTVDTFERRFVFRVARLLPLVSAAVAALALIVGAGLALYSLWPVPKPSQETPAAEPPPVQVAAADVLARVRAAPRSAPAPAPAAAPAAERPEMPAPGPSAEARRIATGIDVVRRLFEAAKVPWEAGYATECLAVGAGGRCLRTELRMSAEGIGGRVFRILGDYDTQRGSERVDVGGGASARPSRTYLVNPSNSDVKVAVLTELAQVLASIPDAERAAALNAWADIRREREAGRRSAIAAEDARVRGVNAQRAAGRLVAMAKRTVARFTSARLIAAALAGTLAVGLMLALLAVERNTREMRRLLLQLQGSSRPATDGDRA